MNFLTKFAHTPDVVPPVDFIALSVSPLEYTVEGLDSTEIESVGFAGLRIGAIGLEKFSTLRNVSGTESGQILATWLPPLETVLPEARDYDSSLLSVITDRLHTEKGPLALFQLGKDTELGRQQIAASTRLGKVALDVKREIGLVPAIETTGRIHMHMSKDKLKQRKHIGATAYEAIIAGYALLRQEFTVQPAILAPLTNVLSATGLTDSL